MKIQHIVIMAVIIAAISLGLQVASNSKLQFDMKNMAFKTQEQDVEIKHLTVKLDESLQLSDLKNKTAEQQEKSIQSLINELASSKQILEKNNDTINQLQQKTTNLNNDIKSLSDRLASLEHTVPSTTPISNATSNSIIKQSIANVTNPILLPINYTFSMNKPEIKILSIAMSPNPLKVGDTPKFTVTFENISDNVILQNMVGCGTNPSLHWEIYPSSSVQQQPAGNNGLTCPPIIKNIRQNETSIASGYAIGNGFYQITQAGTLNIILRMNIEDGSISGIQTTIKFDVNATG